MQIIKGLSLQDASILLVSQDEDDYRYRLGAYIDWLNETHGRWYTPDLQQYRDYLLRDYTGRDGKPLHPNSVRAHLSTIRGRYKQLLSQNAFRDALFSSVDDALPFAERKALVDEIIERLENAIDPINSPVKLTKKQDSIDRTQIRLTQSQARELMNMPDITTLMGLRDRALICLMLCSGLREAELCALNVEDLYQTAQDQPVIHVRHGKGRKERVVPYGSLIWVRRIVKAWLTNAGIDKGAVFRGFYKNAKTVRRTRLTVRAVNQILDKYPLHVDGLPILPKPHDLRRTYARQLYDSGMDLIAIRDNLGHADTRTTLKYIGAMDIQKREPGSIY